LFRPRESTFKQFKCARPQCVKVIGKGCGGERRHSQDPKAAHDEITNEDNAYFF